MLRAPFNQNRASNLFWAWCDPLLREKLNNVEVMSLVVTLNWIPPNSNSSPYIFKPEGHHWSQWPSLFGSHGNLVTDQWSSSLTRWPSQSGKETNFEVILFLECSQFYNIPFRQLPDPLTSTSQMSPLPYYITSSNIIPIWEKTSQELRMLSNVALYLRINMNVEIVVFNCQKSVSQGSQVS